MNSDKESRRMLTDSVSILVCAMNDGKLTDQFAFEAGSVIQHP